MGTAKRASGRRGSLRFFLAGLFTLVMCLVSGTPCHSKNLHLTACDKTPRSGPREADSPRRSGGPCEYKSYAGQATIVSVKEVLPRGKGNPYYDGYEVKFVFLPGEDVQEGYAQVQGRERTLTLSNSWHPGPRFLQKYGIAVGRQFDCTMKVITRGACTPVFFEFPAIDRGDFFEAAD